MGIQSTSNRLCRCLAAGCAVTVLLAGCGGGADNSQLAVRSTLARFADAVAKHEYHELCAQLLAANLTARLAQIGLPCERALATGLARAHNPRLVVRSVRVRGHSASAVVYTTASNQPASQDTLQLIEVGANWRISSLGSSP